MGLGTAAAIAQGGAVTRPIAELGQLRDANAFAKLYEQTETAFFATPSSSSVTATARRT